MLIHSTWILSVSEPTVLPRSYGLELVKQLHQKLGLEMGSETIPSTSYSGILGFYSTSKDFLTFHPDEFYKLSLCGLQEVAAKAIASLELESLEFLGAKFNIINREDETTSYEELYTTLVANEPEPVRQFNLKFLTPTAFAQSSTHLPLPVPSLMFRSWLERWNHFAPIYLGSDELIAYLTKAIMLKHHKIQTRSLVLHKGYVNGFVGDVTLQVLNHADELLANVAHLLVNYARFTGTGMKTRLGMGQTQVNSEMKVSISD
ncbi:MAG: CRISPR system precrRNA processing endoribonuclease RAMP protein Cas6 [Rhizonema sp. PD38]|nr:CRISPR system precrRNA processing endoribonuclease RAMP protein Cas6 [Rhizonema sp. PD38]